MEIKNYKVAIYMRVSCDRQQENEICEMCQKKLIDNYLKEKMNVLLKEYYIDRYNTGGNSSRIEFKRMLNDINNDKINTIIVNSLRDFGRNPVDFQRILKLYKNKDINFISILNNMDTTDKEKVKEFNIYCFLEEEYERNMKQRRQQLKKFREQKRKLEANNQMN